MGISDMEKSEAVLDRSREWSVKASEWLQGEINGVGAYEVNSTHNLKFDLFYDRGKISN